MSIFTCRRRFSFMSLQQFNLYISNKFSRFVRRATCSNRLFVSNHHRTQFCKRELLMKSCCQAHQDLHTGKKWKVIANPKLAEDKELDPADRGCEEGTNAVSHNVLLSALKSCNTIEEQLLVLSETLALTSEDDMNRNAFQNSIVEILGPYLPEFKIHKFGSSSNTLGFKGSDIDICIEMNSDGNKPAEEELLKEVPNPIDVLEGRVDKTLVANLYPKLLLRFIRRVLRKDCPDVNEPIFLIKGRCPILRLYNDKYDLYCDFSCENKSGIRNTKLIRFISHLDNRFPIVARALRYWGKHGKFVGDLEQFNSYAFSLLVIYFLQNTNPPVLPPLNDLISQSEYLKHGDIGDNDLLKASLANFPRSQNTQSSAELFRDFFFYYTFNDFRRVMLPLTSFSVPVKEFESGEEPPTDVFEVGTVCLQDPFRHSFNATCGVAYRHGKRFLSSLVEACNVYQNANFLEPSTLQEHWGLSHVLESTTHSRDNLISTEDVHCIFVPLSLDLCQSSAPGNIQEQLLARACSLIKNIFEHALCFKVKVLHDGAEQLSDTSFKCEVVHNTWVGRQRVFREKFTRDVSNDLLDVERKISEKLIENEETGSVIFRFSCQCFLIEKDQCPNVRLKLTFAAARPMPSILIFFKDYIPKMLKQLL